MLNSYPVTPFIAKYDINTEVSHSALPHEVCGMRHGCQLDNNVISSICAGFCMFSLAERQPWYVNKATYS